jgi:hypothetical protein
MSKPTITEYQRPDHDSFVYELEIPRCYYEDIKYPRLQIGWWLLKLIWRVKKP